MRWLLAASLALAMCMAPQTTAKDLSGLAEQMRESITRIRMTGPVVRWGTCSAFSINQERGWGLTAEHCVVTVNGFEFRVVDDQSRPLEIIARSSTISPPRPEDDLALLEGDIFRELPALTALTIVPEVGTVVATYGFARGERNPFFYVSNVARTRPRWFSLEMAGSLLGGMSGAPVVNDKAQVIGVVTKGTASNTYIIGSWHFQELYKVAIKQHEDQ